MKKTLIVISVMIMMMLACFTGCEYKLDATGSGYQKHYIVDEKTGVNYLFVNSDSGITICPRYNADGSLYITE